MTNIIYSLCFSPARVLIDGAIQSEHRLLARCEIKVGSVERSINLSKLTYDTYNVQIKVDIV